jgi:hypothetical protein
MSYVDDIEIDFAVFLRVGDFWCRPADWILRFAGRLVAYRGSLWAAMERDAVAPAPVPVTGLSTGYPQAVDSPADGDTPPDVVAVAESHRGRLPGSRLSGGRHRADQRG